MLVAAGQERLTDGGVRDGFSQPGCLPAAQTGRSIPAVDPTVKLANAAQVSHVQVSLQLRTLKAVPGLVLC